MKQWLKTSVLTSMAVSFILPALFCRTANGDTSPPGNDAVSLDIELDRNRVYVGETVKVTVTLSAKGGNLRNIGYPQLPPIKGKQLAFTPPQQLDRQHESGAAYRFAAALTPAEAGEFRFGPAAISLELLQSAAGAAAFFGETAPQAVTAQSRTMLLTVLPLPAAGRPKSFAGVAGNFQMTLAPTQSAMLVGAPMTIITKFKGSGDLSRADCPNLESPMVKSYPPRPFRTAGSMRCEQVIIPSAAGALPSLEWSYFNPQQQRYITLTASLPAAAPVGNPSTAEAAVRPQPTQTVPRPATDWQTTGLPVLAALALLLLSLAAWLSRRRRKSPPTAAAYQMPADDITTLVQALEDANESGSVEKFYSLLFGILQRVAASFSGTSAAGVCGVSREAALPAGIELDALFSRCHSVRYGRLVPSPDAMRNDLKQLHTILPFISRELL